MPISAEEKRLLRELAWQVAEAAELPIQTERIRLWRDSNALVPKRAMILADPQNGWNELVPESTLKCQNPFARTIEMTLRRTIFRHQHIHDDYPITKIYPVEISIHKSSYGVENKYVRSDYKNGSYHIEPSIRTFDDMKKLRPAVIEVDWETTYKRMELADDILGDILMVQLRGVSFCRCGLTRILVHMRGLDQMMLDIYDKPEMLHELMEELVIAPEKTLMIGDTTHDVQMAVNAGVAGLAVTYGAHTRDDLSRLKPLACLDDVAQLALWLKRNV